MKKKLLAVILTAVLAVSMTACTSTDTVSSKNPDSAVSNGADAVNSTTEPAAEPTANEEIDTELYNAYIDVNNLMFGRFYDSVDRYYTYVDYQEEFVIPEGLYTCYNIGDYDIEKVDNAYEMATAKTEKLTLDTAFIEMYPSLSASITALNEIYDYSDMKAYLDDNYEKGREYHAALWAALAEYETTSAVFREELGSVINAQREKDLAALKENGYEVLYTVNLAINAAQDLQSALYEQGVTDENIMDMDLSVIQPLYDEFNEIMNTLLEMSKDEEKLAEEGVPSSSTYWSSFITGMKNAKTSVVAVIQRVKDEKPFGENDLIMDSSGTESLAGFDSSVSDMIDGYNGFINAF